MVPGQTGRLLPHTALPLAPSAGAHLAEARVGDVGERGSGVAQRAFFVARLRGGVSESAIAAIADGTRR